MKVLIYDLDCPGGGVRYPIKEAFETLGHQATMFDWQRYLYAYGAPGRMSKIKDKLLFKVVAKRVNKFLLEDIANHQYDLLLIVRGDHVYPETIVKAKQHIPLVVNWSTDDLFNSLNNTKYMLECFSKYDCIFSPREHLREEYLKNGARSFENLNWYYRLGLLYPAPTMAKREYSHDIVFVGAWSKRRERILSALEGLNVSIFGWGWGKKTPQGFFARSTCRPALSMKDMHDVFASSKINVNILTIENKDTTNLRNFEIPAAGGFQLSERSNEILQLFQENEEIVCFGNGDEIRGKCEYYLNNETERQNIALAGYRRLIAGNHSIVDRVRQILVKVNALAGH